MSEGEGWNDKVMDMKLIVLANVSMSHLSSNNTKHALELLQCED